MIKKIALACLAVIVFLTGYTQTLFTYGSNVVTKEEFVRAFNKNPGTGANRKQALKEYLDLYINFKLKVKAAYDAKMQNDPMQMMELNNFRQQIAENIINEEAKLNELVNEALERSQKDIRLAQVFIELPASGDTSEAFKKIQAAWNDLKSGKDFGKTAVQYSNDTYTRQTAGDLGFITVFTLPYQFETVAYNTRPGTFSIPFRSKIGYHIFKNVEERKPWGNLKIAQVLIAWPPNATPSEKAAAKSKVDSVYSLLENGAAFAELAHAVSNDNVSASIGGQMPEMGIGMYSPAFENAAYSLKKTGDYTKPIETEFGYHIIQLLQPLPVEPDVKNMDAIAAMQEKIKKEDRLEAARKAMLEKQMKVIGYKFAPINKADLWRYTDSMLQNKKDYLNRVNDKTILFSFAKQKITGTDWANFIKSSRAASPQFADKKYPALLDQFVHQTASNYYRNHLEDYSVEYRKQVQEFKDANLLFGIMDLNVWGKANTDTNGLKTYYAANKNKYLWQPSADALIVTVYNDSVVALLQEKLEQNPGNWREFAEEYHEKATIDSGRYELGQLQVFERTNFQPELVTAPVRSKTDEVTTFNYIFKVYPGGEARSFNDAKGMVISDYQQVLENRWLAQLKKKYPVKVNTVVFNSIK